MVANPSSMAAFGGPLSVVFPSRFTPSAFEANDMAAVPLPVL